MTKASQAELLVEPLAKLSPEPSVNNSIASTTDLDSSILQQGSAELDKMNAMLRSQVQQLVETPTTACLTEEGNKQKDEESASVSQLAARATAELLKGKDFDRQHADDKLNQLFERFMRIYHAAPIAKSLRRRRFIHATGLIISPDHCTTTIKDTLRLRAFIRGIDQALRERSCTVNKKIRIVYPACGPFAPLLVPLLCFYNEHKVYSADELGVTFIDIQEGATRALGAVLEEAGVLSYVENICCCNAIDFDSENHFDVLVLEAMQHGFSREGHLSIAKHFSRFIKNDGVMIPQSIEVDAALAIGQREFVEQWKWEGERVASPPERDIPLKFQGLSAQQLKSQQFKKERTPLGRILTLNLDFLKHMEPQALNDSTQLIQCETVTLPDIPSDGNEYILILLSRLNTYGENWLDEYESGITHALPDLSVCLNFIPRARKDSDVLVRSGDRLQFFYCINGLPGFLPIAQPKVSQGELITNGVVDDE